MPSQLTDLIRKKYPGHYDDMSDDDLEKAVLDKHPEYKDLATPSKTEKPVDITPERTTINNQPISQFGDNIPPSPTVPNSPISSPQINSPKPTNDSEPQSLLSRIWHGLSDPLTTAPSTIANKMSQTITTPKEGESPYWAMAKGALGGGLEGIGNLVSGATSPLSIATLGLGGAEAIAGKTGFEALANAANIGQRVAGVPMVMHGGYEMLRPDATMGERGQGLVEAAGGLAGAMYEPVVEKANRLNPAISHDFAEQGERINPSLLDQGAVLPPEMVPMGGESEYSGMFQQDKLPDTENLKYNIARDRFNMGEDMPDMLRAKQGETPIPESWADTETNKLKEYQDYRKNERLEGRKPSDYNVWESKQNEPEMAHDTGPLKPREIDLDEFRANLPPNPDWEVTAAEDALDKPMTIEGRKEANANIDEMEQRIDSGASNNEPISEANDSPTKPTLGNSPNILLKADKVTPELVKKAKEQGYELIGQNDRGDFRFKKTGQPNADQPILESEVGAKRYQKPQSTLSKVGEGLGEVNALSRALMATADMSAPLRQGIGLIHKPEFWKSLGPMVRAFGSNEFYEAAMKSIDEKPLFRSRVNGKGEIIPSFAQDMGLSLTGIGKVNPHEEAFASRIANKIPGVKPSERAYSLFLNKLRADTFESLVKDNNVLGGNGQPINSQLGHALADFVNTATGRGSLGKLENSSKALSQVLFAPRLISSRLQMLDPRRYLMGNTVARQEALKSLLATVSTGIIVGQLAKAAGAEVSNDPTSSDFGKIKIGNTRLDPFAGLQQYVVALSRLMSNKTTSSTTGRSYELGSKFGRQTRFDVAERFGESKLAPLYSFATAWAYGKDFAGNKFNPTEELVSRFVPLMVQDLKAVLTENPNITSGYDKFKPERAPLAIPGFFGVGTQQYGDINRRQAVR